MIYDTLKKSVRSEQGMTLVEIMIVLVIIGLITTLVAVKVQDSLADAKIRTTETNVKNLESALQLYMLKCNNYPTTEDGLEALVTPPSSGKCKNYPPDGFIGEVPDDAFGRPYHYQYPGTHNPRGVDIWSDGPTEDAATPIGNWKSETNAE